MSGNLSEVLNCVEILVKKIREKRDFILSQFDGKQCVSTTQMALLINSFVDQLLDSSDIKPEEELVAKLSEDPHKVFVDRINAEKQLQNDLYKKIDILEKKLVFEVKDKLSLQKRLDFEAKDNQNIHNRMEFMTKDNQNLHKQFDECVKTFDNKEEEYVNRIKELNQTIENLMATETELKSKLNELNLKLINNLSEKSFEAQIKQEIKEELNKRYAINAIKVEEELTEVRFIEDKDEEMTQNGDESDSDSESEDQNDLESEVVELESEDQRLKEKCLKSKAIISIEPLVVVEDNDYDIKSIDLKYGSDTEESIAEVPNQLNNNLTEESNNCLEIEVIKDKRKYLINRLVKGVQYVCNYPKCGYIINSLKTIRSHCRTHTWPESDDIEVEKITEKIESEVNPDYKCSDCDMTFKTRYAFRYHSRRECDKSQKVAKTGRQLRKRRDFSEPEIKRSLKSLRQMSSYRVKKEVINGLID